jgi:2-polyprenyl-3-methyl-5-hydroxy-6-metoxy-1,4-benzoquinol methylase
MATVKDHYDSHLAPLYTWMSGGAEGPRARFAALLTELALRPSRPGATALDLGAGSGFQSIPLAEAGYTVTAIDLSAGLIAELRAASGALPIRATLGDLREVARHSPMPAPEVIVCMGDTLTHLSSVDEVSRLIHDAARALAPGGHLLLSFRDYTRDRYGADRFIPVRSDADRIFTCFLDFHSPTHLTVHDLIQTRAADGWRTAISVYEKIRLAPGWVLAQLEAAGLRVIRNTAQNGLVTFVARRPELS